ncbi:MAG: hypothetical protein GTN43_04955 [Candidatus Aenigmarchaeota archaeon]|nr:hypothetical protein [Candidatus Aenigmarchaeota archaeon]
MAVGTYVCKKCNRNYNIRDSESYKTDLYIMIFLCVFVTIFIVSIPLLLVTVPITYYFYRKRKELGGKTYYCQVCRTPLEKTGKIEIEKEELLKEGV